MPNLKIDVESTVWSFRKTELLNALQPIRSMLCRDQKVDVSACQLAIVPVFGLDDQPRINAEMFILQKSQRTSEILRDVCRNLQNWLSEAGGCAGCGPLQRARPGHLYRAEMTRPADEWCTRRITNDPIRMGSDYLGSIGEPAFANEWSMT